MSTKATPDADEVVDTRSPQQKRLDKLRQDIADTNAEYAAELDKEQKRVDAAVLSTEEDNLKAQLHEAKERLKSVQKGKSTDALIAQVKGDVVPGGAVEPDEATGTATSEDGK